MTDDPNVDQLERQAVLQEKYWLEVSGEQHPIISPLSERGPGTPDPTVPADPHLYEYAWTLEYPESLVARSRRQRRAEGDLRIRLLFPVVPGWRVTEVMATVTHLRPVEHEEDLRAQLAKDWADLAPMVAAGARVASDVAGVPEIGSVAGAIARLKVSSVPQTDTTRWFVTRVHQTDGETHWRGSEWHLPVALLDAMGTRISGGLLVAFRKYHGADPPASTEQRASQDVPPVLVDCWFGPDMLKEVQPPFVVSPTPHPSDG